MSPQEQAERAELEMLERKELDALEARDMAARGAKVRQRSARSGDAARASVDAEMTLAPLPANERRGMAAMGALDTFLPSFASTIASPLGFTVAPLIHGARELSGLNDAMDTAAEADPQAYGVGDLAGTAMNALTGVPAAALSRTAAAPAARAAGSGGVPILQRAAGAIDDAAKAHPVLEKIARVVGGERAAALLDLAKKGKKPPVAGPANAAAPTLDVPNPVPVQALADDVGPQTGSASGLDLDLTRAVDDVPTRSSLTAAELAPLKERMQAATPQGAPAAGNPRDAAGNWSMTADELNAAQGQVPGRPPVQVPSEGTQSMRRPVVDVADDMILESAPVPPSAPPVKFTPPITDGPMQAPQAPSGALEQTAAVGGDKTARIPKAELAELRLQAAAPTPEIAPPPPLSSIESAPVDPMIALAARARQRGINQRFSVDGSRERAQIQALNGKAERQAFFDDLARIHGKRQTAPLAREFALEMPADAPRFSSLPGWMRQASNTGAHTGPQERSGTPFADMGGNGPAIREAFAASRAPIEDDAARGLALEAQGAALSRPAHAFDAATGQPLPKYKPKDEAERAALMALDRDTFDAVIEGRMTLDEARAPSLAKAAPAPKPEAFDAERAAIEAAGGTVRDIEAIKGRPIRQIDLDDATVGAVRIVDKDGRETVIHRSTKFPGKWQASRFDAEGPSGDTQFSTLAEAVKHSRTNGGRVAEVQRGNASPSPKPDAFDEPSFIRKSADEMGIEGDDLKSKTWHARELGDAIEPGYVRAQAEKRRKEMALPLDRGEALREILQENGIDVAGIKERKIGALDNFDAGKDKKKIDSLAQAWSKSTRSKKSWDEIGNDLDALAEALGVEKLRMPERIRNIMERHAIEDAPDLKTNPAVKKPR